MIRLHFDVFIFSGFTNVYMVRIVLVTLLS